MDKDYVKEIIEGLGGVRALMDEMDEYHEIVARMRKERSSLVERHTDKWVVMGQEGVLAVGDSMDECDYRREVNGRTASRATSLCNMPLTLSRSTPRWAGAEMAANRIRPEDRNSMARIPLVGNRHSICANPSGVTPICGAASCRSLMRKRAIARNDSSAIDGSSGSSSTSWRR